MYTYVFEIMFTDPKFTKDKPLRFLQQANGIIEAWEEVLRFEIAIWGEDLVSIKYIGQERDTTDDSL